MRDLQKQIKSHWKPPHGRNSKRVVALFKILRDGTIIDVKVDRPTKDTKSNEAALNAIRELKRANRLPAGAPDDVDVQFTFDYNVFFGGNKAIEESTPLTSTGSSGVPEQKYFRKGTELYDKGSYTDAIAYYVNALALYQKQVYADNTKQITEIMSQLAKCNAALSKKFKNDPNKRIKYLHQSVYYDPDDTEYRKALWETIKQLGKNPDIAEDHVLIGDEAETNGDNVGAVVEYMEALKIKEDPAVQQKIQRIKDSYGKRS